MQRSISFIHKCRQAVAAVVCGGVVVGVMAQVTGTTPVPQIQDPVLGTTGPYQLRNVPAPNLPSNVYIPPVTRPTEQVLGRYVPGEFEIYVNRLANSPVDAPIRRFGANLVTGIQLMTALPADGTPSAAFAQPTSTQSAGTTTLALPTTTAGALTTAPGAFEA